MEIVRGRRDVLHLLALSEMTHFTQERRKDIKDMMKTYLDEQIQFYENVCVGDVFLPSCSHEVLVFRL